MRTWAAVLGALALVTACKDDGGADAAGDATVRADAAGPDAGRADGGPSDGGRADSGHVEADAAQVEADAAQVEADAAQVEADGGHMAADAAPTDGAVPDPAAVAYCNCMLVTCHDLYHQAWGEDEVQARGACLQVAAALPRNGAPATEGDFLECRQHHCDAAVEDEPACLAALGGGACR